MLAVIETHPIQYHAPVYRVLQQSLGVPVTAIYGSDFSVAGYRDREFGVEFAWDTDLLDGYRSIFLSRGRSQRGPSRLGRPRRGAQASGPVGVLLLGYSIAKGFILVHLDELVATSKSVQGILDSHLDRFGYVV